MKPFPKLKSPALWAFPAVGLLLAAIAYPFLPEQFITRWDDAGQPAQTMHKAFLFVLPLLLGFCVFVFTWLPAQKARSSAQRKTGRGVSEPTVLHILFFVFLLGAEALVIRYGMGGALAWELFLWLGIGGALAALGGLIPALPFARKGTAQGVFRALGAYLLAGGACVMGAALLPTPWAAVALGISVAAALAASGIAWLRRQKNSG